MARTRGHFLNSEEAKMLLEHVTLSRSNDPRFATAKVEIPLNALTSLFDISYPLNLLYRDEKETIRPAVNGFNRTTTPPTANFYLKTLAGIAGMTPEDARSRVENNTLAGASAGIARHR